jgi:hypothetical protein
MWLRTTISVNIPPMAYANIEDSRAAIRQHYYANKEQYLEKNRQRRKFLKQFVNEIKSSTACTDCKIYYPFYVMDFDHLQDKLKDINELIKGNNLKAVKREIEKCEVVCANCHRLRTYTRLTQNLVT